MPALDGPTPSEGAANPAIALDALEAVADIAALHGRYALACARHGLDPLEFLRKVTFDSAYADKRQSDSARRRGEEAGAEPESANSLSLEEALDGVFEDRRGDAAKDGEKGREELFQEESLRQKFEKVSYIPVTEERLFSDFNRIPGKLSEKIKLINNWLEEKKLFGSYYNKDCGWHITVSKGSIRSTAFHGLGILKAKALTVLPKLLEEAIYVQKGKIISDKDIRHIFAAKALIGGEKYAIGIVIRETPSGKLFYDHELTEVTNLDSPSQGLPEKVTSRAQENQDSVLKILQNKLGVKQENPTILLQEKNHKRGSVRLYSDAYLVSLFEKADLSTLLHESGHIFFEEMGSLVEKGLADKAMRADYNALRGWLGAKEGAALARGQREQAARGFEAWLREGRAPDAALGGAFGRFRKWLLAVYRKAKSLDAPLSDEVRGVFDRMLATERKISDAARKRGLGGLSRRELALLGLSQSEAAQAEALPRAARDKAALALEDAERKRGEADGAASGDAKIDAAACLLAQDEAAAQMALAEERLAQELGHEPASLSDFALAAEDTRKLLPQAKSAARARHLAAMRRNHQLFRKALADGGREAALDYNRKALFNLFCARKTDAA